MNKAMLSLILGIFLIGLVSANGLLTSPTTLNVNKSENVDYLFDLNVKNSEGFTMTNITSGNSIIQFTKFNLNAGENKTVQAKIVTNSNFNGSVRIRGDYLVSAGTSNKTETININYNNGLSKCNLNFVVGDRIIWVNQVGTEIKLRNADTNQEIATISANQNYTKELGTTEEFNYYATVSGLPFTETCNINVMGTTGYVHNSELDALLALNITLNYAPTTIDLILFTNSYNTTYNSPKQDVLKITNTGSQKARSVKLSGDWLGFSVNNFDLEVGESKNIQYTITPLILETNQTNKSYRVNLKADGNFPRIERNMSVFIQYANIIAGSFDTSVNYEFLQNTIKLYCQIDPDFCSQFAGINGINSSQRIVSAIFGEDTVKDLLATSVQNEIDDQTYRKNQLEVDTNQTYQIGNLSNKTDATFTKLVEMEEGVNTLSSVLMFSFIFVLSSLVVAMVLFLIFNQKARNVIGTKLGLHKGEKAWA